jgi:small GTP-binding protein
VTQTIHKKICLLGDFAVGKTSLVSRYVDNQFSDEYLSTIGVKISRKRVELAKGAVQIIIWDLEGRSIFANASNAYLQGASGAIIGGDLTRPDTVCNISSHIAAFLAVNPGSVIAIALNKADLLHELPVAAEQRFGSHEQVIHTEFTSAKTGSGVQELFETLGRNLMET